MNTVYMLEPITENCKEFIDENVEIEGWQYLGNAFGVGQHFIDGLVDLLEDNGLLQGKDFVIYC